MTIFVCVACGAVQQHHIIMCEKCGKPLVFDQAEAKRFAYHRDAARRAPWEGADAYGHMKRDLRQR